MGDSGGGGNGFNINWNPGDSTLGRTISGQQGGAFKGGIDWDPRNSTMGQAAQGNWGEVGRGVTGGIQDAANFNKNLLGGLAAPGAALYGGVDSMFGTPQAALRKKHDDAASTAQGAQEQAQGNYQKQQEAYNQQQQKASTDANNAYQSQQATLNQSLADEDAFTAARNAARRAKGTSLFGAYNG